MTHHGWLVELEHILEHLEVLEESICKSVPLENYHQVSNHFRRMKFHAEKNVSIVQKWNKK